MIHAATVNAGVERTHALLHHAIAIVPWGEPVRLAGTENGDDRFSQSCCKMGGKGVMTKNGVGRIQNGRQRSNIGRAGEMAARHGQSLLAGRRDFNDGKPRGDFRQGEKLFPQGDGPLFARQARVGVYGENLPI